MRNASGRPADDDPPNHHETEYIEPPVRSKEHTRRMMEQTYLAIFGPNGSLAAYARKLKYVRSRRR